MLSLSPLALILMLAGVVICALSMGFIFSMSIGFLTLGSGLAVMGLIEGLTNPMLRVK